MAKASGDAPSPDKFGSAPSDGDESNNENLQVAPGEEHVGKITGANLGLGNNGAIEIDGQMFWLNGTTQRDLVAGLLEGHDIMVDVSEETESFEDENGETVEYHPKNLRFVEDDD